MHAPGVDAESRKITVANFFGNVSTNVVFNGTVSMSNTSAPTTITSSGHVGEIRYDVDHIYICVATNTWKRAALNDW